MSTIQGAWRRATRITAIAGQLSSRDKRQLSIIRSGAKYKLTDRKPPLPSPLLLPKTEQQKRAQVASLASRDMF